MKELHTIVADAFYGPRPKRMEVNHKNLDRHNCRPDNLEYTTRLDNVRHAAKHLNFAVGENNSQAKLTAAQVRQIFKLYKKHTAMEISVMFNMNATYIRGLLGGCKWRSVVSQKMIDEGRKHHKKK